MAKLWGGCFSKEIDQDVLEYTQTTDIDKRLIRFDIWGSLAHLLMLYQQSIVSGTATREILPALLDLYSEALNDRVSLDPDLEDVHLNIESKLIDAIGAEFGGRLHTARSRNDQVVTDTRMYLRQELLNIEGALLSLISELLRKAEEAKDALAVGYTHLQPAQPISIAFWYSAHASILLRDLERITAAYSVTNCSPLGACALAGTSFPLDRERTRTLLGFDRLLEHALDATSSRDFVLQSLSAFAILIGNFSRMAEEIVVWNSNEFGLLAIDDAFATGSSIMPQKRNPVVAELVKGRVGRVYGALMQMLTTVKGVTLGYNCDLQEDKPLLWDAITTIHGTIRILRSHIATSEYNSQRAEELCWRNFSTVTELANYLVREKRIPFRDAHQITGELTRTLIAKGADLRDTDAVLQFLDGKSVHCAHADLQEIVSPGRVVARQISQGSTGPASVRSMVASMRTAVRAAQDSLDQRENRLLAAENLTLDAARAVLDGRPVAALEH